MLQFVYPILARILNRHLRPNYNNTTQKHFIKYNINIQHFGKTVPTINSWCDYAHCTFK